MKEDVIKRIVQTIRNKAFRDKLIQKVMNDEDLTLSESKMVYGPVDFGEQLPMTKKRPIDIDWTDHAEYRSELRNIRPNSLNESVKEKVKERFLKNPKTKNKENFKVPSGTAVVDFDTRENPAEAEIVTTWASERNNMLTFASENEAIQYLANATGKRIKIAEFKPNSHIDSPEEIEKEMRKFINSGRSGDEGISESYSEWAGIMRGKYEVLYREYQSLINHLNEKY